MNDRIVEIRAPQKLDAATRRALFMCGFWMRAALVGASAAAAGVIQFFNDEWSALTALSTVMAGAALAAFAWRRAHAALSDPPEAPTLPVATPAAAHR